MYLPGKPADNTSGYVETTLRSGSYNYRFDWLALTAMGFTIKANVIVGSRALSDDALAAVKAGTPYMGYSNDDITGRSAFMQELGVEISSCDKEMCIRDRSKAVLEQCKKALKDIQATFSVPEAELLEDLRQMAPAMLALLSLTARFTLRYQAEKVRRNVMDFSDQEHYAIDLLTDGQGQPTDLARQVASRYREVMVDEYQDSNQVQNCIFRAL